LLNQMNIANSKYCIIDYGVNINDETLNQLLNYTSSFLHNNSVSSIKFSTIPNLLASFSFGLCLPKECSIDQYLTKQYLPIISEPIPIFSSILSIITDPSSSHLYCDNKEQKS